MNKASPGVRITFVAAIKSGTVNKASATDAIIEHSPMDRAVFLKLNTSKLTAMCHINLTVLALTPMTL